MNLGAKVITYICLGLICFATTLGASFVLFIKRKISPKASDLILGFASGIMIAAAIFGLLVPSINQAKELYANWAVLPVIVGFLLGGLMLYILDKVVPHIHALQNKSEGPENSNLTKQIKFVLAVTIHNIPEGLSVGFACAIALSSNEPGLAASALALAIGIAIQNVPEGAAVSIPLLGEGVKKSKAFGLGFLSGVVEPIAGVLAILIGTSLGKLLPWALAFAAGAMIYVTIDELLPTSRQSENEHIGLWAFMIGFIVMLVLEIVLS